MVLWRCSHDDCHRAAVQKSGDCILCDKHLCRVHLQDMWHKCPHPEQDWKSYSTLYVATEARQMKELCSRLDGSALSARASLLRGGTPCTVDVSSKGLSRMMGGQNCHAEIRFEDNVQWIARLRLAKTSSPPVEVRNYVLQSEAATMQYLRRHTRIPCPEVFDWCCESSKENEVGVGYILMEKMPGKPLDWGAADANQREKIMQQLADLYVEIERHPFSAVGSLLHKPATASEFRIGGIARPATFRLGSGGPLGPFRSSVEASKELVDCYLQMITSGEIAGNQPLDVYLAHRYRLDVLRSLWEDDCSGESFFLMHPDDKGDHIFVNESFEIVGILDWEWCQTVPKQLAFSSPCMMWPVAEFYEGSNALSDDELRFAAIFKEKGHDDLASHVLNGRRAQRFFFFLGGDAHYTDWKTFSDLFLGLRRAFEDPTSEWEQWKAHALENYRGEKLLDQLLEQEACDRGNALTDDIAHRFGTQ